MGNATSGIGQGLAFILPENKSATYAMQLAQTHSAQLQYMAKQKKAQALKDQQEYQKAFQEQKLPEAFAPFDKKINEAQTAWQNKWSGNYASTGKNPFNNPDAMNEYRENVLIPAHKSKELGANYTKLRSLAETDPTNKYTKESKQAVIDYENKIKSDPMGALDGKIPQLVETPATVNELVKTLTPIPSKTNNGSMETKGPDSSSHKAQAFTGLLGDPKYHDVLKQYGYNPDLPDFGVYTDPNHPNGKRVWYTNPTFTEHQADLILSSPEDPKNANILATLGIYPGDQYAKEKLQHAITDQNSAMGKAVTDVSGRLDVLVPPESKKVYGDERMAMAEQHLSITEQRLALATEKASGKTEDKIPYSEHMRNGVPHSGEILREAFKANSAYQMPLKFTKLTDHKGNETGGMDITVPDKTKSNPAYNPNKPISNKNPKRLVTERSHTIRLDPSKPGEYNASVSELVKKSGGDKKLNEALKLSNNAPQHKTSIKQTDIAAKAAASGYTTKEYIDLLKQKGIKIE